MPSLSVRSTNNYSLHADRPVLAALIRVFRATEFWLATGFTLFYSAYEWWIFPSFLPFVPERMPARYQLVAQVISFLWVLAFVWFSLLSRGKVRLLYLGVFAVAVISEYGAYYSVGRFSISEDYAMVLRLIDPRLYFNAVSIYTGLYLPSAIPILVYAACLFAFRRQQRLGLRFFTALLAILFIGYSLLYPLSSGVFRTLSLPANLRSWTFLAWKTAYLYRGPRLVVPAESRAAPQDNIVFIVDESIRGDHLSLNGYERPTTPYLEELQRQGVLYNWKDSAASATASVYSNTLLLTGVNQLPDVAQDTRRMPTLFAYAKAMGYRVSLLDVQMNTRWLMQPNDYVFVDEWLTEHDFSHGAETDMDLEAARWMEAKLRSSTGNFIWINKMGAHFPYASRYPPDAALWQPTEAGTEYDPSKRTELVNSYDAAVAYNLENFFRLLIRPETLEHTVFVYTSDHGQTLSEHGETWPQTGPTRNEAKVPIFIISGRLLSVDLAFKASHQNLFATLLDLMHLPQASRLYSYAPALFDTTANSSQPRFYIVGDITSALRSALYDYDKELVLP
jgi:glucan phosphoethanolaminetransferase (alkaline phosphatase superfamily)